MECLLIKHWRTSQQNCQLVSLDSPGVKKQCENGILQSTRRQNIAVIYMMFVRWQMMRMSIVSNMDFQREDSVESLTRNIQQRLNPFDLETTLEKSNKEFLLNFNPLFNTAREDFYQSRLIEKSKLLCPLCNNCSTL